MTIDYVKLATEIEGNMTDGQEINMLKLEVAALKQQLHTERESLKKEADELMMKKIEHYEKEISLVREDAQIDILNQAKKHADNIFEKDNRIKELEIINKEHQKLNGELQIKLSQYEDKAAHYRRKAIL